MEGRASHKKFVHDLIRRYSSLSRNEWIVTCSAMSDIETFSGRKITAHLQFDLGSVTPWTNRCGTIFFAFLQESSLCRYLVRCSTGITCRDCEALSVSQIAS